MRDQPFQNAGYVYFVQARTSGLIKIGYATNLLARISAIRSQSPEGLSFLGYIETLTPRSLEAGFHARFAKAKSHGEWFKPTPGLIKAISKQATPPPDSHWNEVALQAVYGVERLTAPNLHTPPPGE